jgi:hypothetical protein
VPTFDIDKTGFVGEIKTIDDSVSPQRSRGKMFKNTERELQIINGEDPDAKLPEPAQEEVSAETTATTDEVAVDTDTEVEVEQFAQPVVAEEQEAPVGKEATATDWFSAEDSEYARSYNLSDEDLKSFPNRNAFRQATSIIDKQTASLGRPSQEAKVAPVAEEVKKVEDDLLDPAELEREGFDPKVIALAKSLRTEREHRIAAEKKAEEEISKISAYHAHLQQQESAREQYRKINEFHDILDSQEADLLGRSLDESGKIKELTAGEVANRKAVYEATEELREGIIARAQKLGQEPVLPSSKVLVQRALNMVLGDEIRKLESQRQVAKIAAQAKKVRPVGTPRKVSAAITEPPKTFEEQVKAYANSPALEKAWEAAQNK